MARWKMFVDDGAAKLKVNCNTRLDKIIVNLMELKPINVLSFGEYLLKASKHSQLGGLRS